MNNDLISRSSLLGGYDVRKVTEYDESGCGLEYKAVPVEAIEAAPTIDAVEVVRCQECVYFEFDCYCTHDKMEHSRCLSCDYCSYGERKMDGDVSENEL